MLEVEVVSPHLSKSLLETCQIVTVLDVLTDLAITPEVLLAFSKAFDEVSQCVIYLDHIFQFPHMEEVGFDLVQIHDETVQLIKFSYLWKAIPRITLDGRWQ